MQKPQIRMWINAKDEILNHSQHAEEVLIITNLEEELSKKLLFDTLFPLIKEIIILDTPPNAVKISYNPTRVSLSFIKYCLLQKNLIAEVGNG